MRNHAIGRAVGRAAECRSRRAQKSVTKIDGLRFVDFLADELR